MHDDETSHYTVVSDPLPLLVQLQVVKSPLLLETNARIRTLNVTGGGAVIHVTTPQSLVVYAPPCEALPSGLHTTGAKPLMFTRHKHSPSSGGLASRTALSGTLNADWDVAYCRFGSDAAHPVVPATLTAASTASDPCGNTWEWNCAVPLAPDGVTITEVAFSVDAVNFHPFAEPYLFVFQAGGTRHTHSKRKRHPNLTSRLSLCRHSCVYRAA